MFNAMSLNQVSFANALRANSDIGGLPLLSNVDEIHSDPKLNFGENGTLQYTTEGVESIALAMFSGLCRDVPIEKIEEYIDKYIEQYDAMRHIDFEKAKTFLCDLFLILFEKRDCRGGEGERLIFAHMIWKLYSKFKHITSAMIELIPEYGSWKDPWNLIEYVRIYELTSIHRYQNLIKSSDEDNDSTQSNDESKSDESNLSDDDLPPLVTGRTGLRAKMSKSRKSLAAKLLESRKSLRDPVDLFIKTEFADDMIRVAKQQFEKDKAKWLPTDKSLSLLAKWLPTEKSEFAKHNHKVWKSLVRTLVGLHSTTPEKDYRKILTEMRAKIDIPEAKMCSGRFSEINPKTVPSVCGFKFRKAFLNTLTDSEAEKRGREPGYLPDTSEYETGNRFPEDEDRVSCRKNWLDAIKEKKIKGGQLSPDALVVAIRAAQTPEEISLIDAQYEDLLKKTQDSVDKAKADGFDPMDNIIPMVDMSPSMNGTPKNAAIGLGIMLSDLNSKEFGGLAITFDDQCHVVDFSATNTFSEKVALIDKLPMGYSTNFHLAMQRVCEIVEKYKIPEDSVPSLCILSDEQFDHHQFGYNATMEDQLVKMFHDVGVKVGGTPYKKPRTVHWNLRGDTDGFPAKADHRNVQMLTGYSPALFDLILCGKPEPTPYDTMRRKLDSARYDPVREAFARSSGFLDLLSF